MKLPEIKLLRLTFRLEAQASVGLPPFLGSTLRGAFGAALKKIFCFVPHGVCEQCWFYEVCPYQYVFESPNLIPKAENHPKLRGQKEVPQPFVLVPPIPELKTNRRTDQRRVVNFNEDYRENHFSAGETLEFSVILIGKSALYWAQILVAVRLAGQEGLGAARVPFVLTEAFAHDSLGKPTLIFNAADPKVSGYGTAAVSLNRIVELRTQTPENENNEKNDSRIRIEFQTPTRIRIADQIDVSVTLSDLLKKITERLEFLVLLHADPPQRIDYREFLFDAENCPTEKNNFRLYQYEQFSSRQESKTKRDVVIGSADFTGEKLKTFLPFLLAGELLNVGSNTSAGFGKYTVKTLHSSKPFLSR